MAFIDDDAVEKLRGNRFVIDDLFCGLCVGSGLLEAVKAVKNAGTDRMFPGWIPTIIAMIISFLLGYIVIIGFLKFVSTFSYKAFSIYRIGLSVIVALLLLFGALKPYEPVKAASAASVVNPVSIVTVEQSAAAVR